MGVRERRKVYVSSNQRYINVSTIESEIPNGTRCKSTANALIKYKFATAENALDKDPALIKREKKSVFIRCEKNTALVLPRKIKLL